MTEDPKTELLALLAPHAEKAEALLERWCAPTGAPETLAMAMRYSVLDGGKRLRPALVWMACEAAGGGGMCDLADRAAVAVELIHAYSLVHDDLPAMDDDVLRRGRPTVHVEYGEAMAILVGDALLTRALGLLGEHASDSGARLVAELATAAGGAGMVAGQVADMDLCDIPDGRAGIEYIHARKTGAIIRAAVRMGAICGGASDVVLQAVTTYAEKVGLAFQVVDDLLDVTATTESLGKTAGKDERDEKRSIVAMLGVDAAQTLADTLTNDAIDALSPLGDQADGLRRLAACLAERVH
jgi:farnesyl diphosphate synthase